jgi:hypothetical protein
MKDYFISLLFVTTTFFLLLLLTKKFLANKRLANKRAESTNCDRENVNKEMAAFNNLKTETERDVHPLNQSLWYKPKPVGFNTGESRIFLDNKGHLQLYKVNQFGFPVEKC